MKKLTATFVAIAVIVVVVVSLPVWPVINDADDVILYEVDLYYKGQRKVQMTPDLKLDDLALMLQLYDSSLIPTEKRVHQMSEYYYVIFGSKNGQNFTITTDENSAYMFQGNMKMGWRLKNGDTLQGMIFSSARGELREILLSLTP